MPLDINESMILTILIQQGKYKMQNADLCIFNGLFCCKRTCEPVLRFFSSSVQYHCQNIWVCKITMCSVDSSLFVNVGQHLKNVREFLFFLTYLSA